MNMVINFRKHSFLSDIGAIVFIVALLGPLTYFMAYFLRIYLAPLFLFVLLPVAWPPVWRIFLVLVFQQPALVINSLGIQIFPVRVPSRFFIRWSEIQKISIDQYHSEHCLCIYPKDKTDYFSRLSLFKRAIIRIFNPKGEPVMNAPLLYLDKPKDEILQQLSLDYAHELQKHEVQLQF